VEVLAAGEGNCINGGLVEGNPTILKAMEAAAPLVLVTKRVFMFIFIKVL
jgi:hypothetical protein